VESSRPIDHEALHAAGLDGRAIGRLAHLKRCIATGERDELTRAHKYLLYGKYLVESRRLDEGGI
jgi:hypothetical protein